MKKTFTIEIPSTDETDFVDAMLAAFEAWSTRHGAAVDDIRAFCSGYVAGRQAICEAAEKASDSG